MKRKKKVKMKRKRKKKTRIHKRRFGHDSYGTPVGQNLNGNDALCVAVLILYLSLCNQDEDEEEVIEDSFRTAIEESSSSSSGAIEESPQKSKTPMESGQ